MYLNSMPLRHIIYIVSLIVLLLAPPAYAEKFNETEISGNFSGFENYLPDSAAAVVRRSTLHSNGSSDSIPLIKLSANLKGAGRVKVILDRKRTDYAARRGFIHAGSFSPDERKISLFKGVIQTKLGLFPSSASIYKDSEGHDILRITASAKRSARQTDKTYSLEIDLQDLNSKKTAKVKKAFLKKKLACLSEQNGGSNEIQAGAQVQRRSFETAAAVNYKVLEISAYADQEWAARYGANSNLAMASFINDAETLYEDQLGVTFDVKSTVSFSANNSGILSLLPTELLYGFGNYVTDNYLGAVSDVHHLFSGKDLEGFTVGIAWQGTVCLNQTFYRTGLSQFVGPYTHLVFAHELGHNFGALHDTATLPPSIMFPSIDPAYNKFSNSSLSRMNSYISSSGGCLSNASAPPTPQATATPVPVAPTATPAPETPGVPLTPSSPGGPGGNNVGPNEPVPHRYKVKGQVTFGVKKKKVRSYKPRLTFTNIDTGVSTIKKVNSDLQFKTSLTQGNYNLWIELKHKKIIKQFAVGAYFIKPEINKIKLELSKGMLEAVK